MNLLYFIIHCILYIIFIILWDYPNWVCLVIFYIILTHSVLTYECVGGLILILDIIHNYVNNKNKEIFSREKIFCLTNREVSLFNFL